MLITHKTILGTVTELHVNSEGQFYSMIDGKKTSRNYDTLKQAERATRTDLKKDQVRVAVPFTYLSDDNLYPAIARGFHAADLYKILIWIDDGTENGRNESITSWNHQALKPNIPEEDIAWLRKLFARREKLHKLTQQNEALIKAWENEHTFNLNQATKEAVEQAAQAQADEPDDGDTGLDGGNPAPVTSELVEELTRLAEENE
jgi:hypothetical protein